MNIRLVKVLDAFVGRLVTLLFLSQHRESPSEVHSFLIIRPGGIGDAVLLIPTIQAIKNRFTSAEITVLAEVRNGSVFKLSTDVDHILLYDRPKQLLSTLQGNYDVAIDTEQWHRLSALVARLTGAPMLIGFDTNERKRLFSHRIVYSQDDYEMQSFQNLLAPLDIEPGLSEDSFLKIPESVVKKTGQLLETLAGKPFVTIFPGASIPERKWGAVHFGKLAQLLAKFGISGVVVGGAEDKEQGNIIVSECAGLNLAGKTSLSETAAIIEKSALLISGDSGVLHIAVGLGRPTVSLFGPGRSKKWAPRGDRHIVINKELPCSPCTIFGNTPRCPINSRCMKEITVDEVFNAVMMLLTTTNVLPSLCCKKDWIERLKISS
ncbi:MAG TPA: glycosyltransferase family 9 protein [Desulfuromonadaceae bacterium]|jgi:lipopolysaccharide heptosyltransferase II